MTETERATYYVDLIDRLLGSRKYEWCRETLEGIRGHVNMNLKITLKQIEAVDHIITGRLRHDVGPA